MKGQKKIVGREIVSIENYDEYIVATLDDGTKLEISDIILAKESKLVWTVNGKENRNS